VEGDVELDGIILFIFLCVSLSLRNSVPDQKHCMNQLTSLKVHTHPAEYLLKLFCLFVCLHIYNNLSTLQIFMKYNTRRFCKKCSDHLNEG
jgi:hypothetical protein